MIWLLLTYVGYLAALSATLGAVGYVAATRFSLVQRLLATVVNRTLSRLADSEQAAYSVTHTDTGGAGGGGSGGGGAAPAAGTSSHAVVFTWRPGGSTALHCSMHFVSAAQSDQVKLGPPGAPLPAGILATEVSLSPLLLRQTEFAGTQATAAHVQRLELEFPSLSRPLTLRVLGVTLALQQVRLPKVRAHMLAAGVCAAGRCMWRVPVSQGVLMYCPHCIVHCPDVLSPVSPAFSELSCRSLMG
jgi:hypothetical protein